MTFRPVHDAAGNPVATTRPSMRAWAADHIALTCERCGAAVPFADRHKKAPCFDEKRGCVGVSLLAVPADPYSAKLMREWRAWLHSPAYNGAAAERAEPKPRSRRAAA